MNLLTEQLRKRKKYLERVMEETEIQLKNAPQGKLRIRNDNGAARYYHVTEKGDTLGKYIKKDSKELAGRLAQKDYLLKLHEEAKVELEDICRYLMRYEKNNSETVYDNLNSFRKSIVTPIALSDEQYVKRWESEHYLTNEYLSEEKVYPTRKDELVRSKSEVMLADMYEELGIPYRYEALLILKNGKKKYPDFTLLKVKTRELIYHEHFGLLDKEEYRLNNFAKVEEYRKNGIYLGKNFIITYEAEGYPLNIKEIKKMITEIML